jgi:transposase-like protein
MESNNCISCGKTFSSSKKVGQKKSLSSKLVGIDRTVKDVLQKDLGVKLTPDQKSKRFLCTQCIWTISSFAKSQEASAQALKKIKETAHGPTYLAKKLRSPAITPRKVKKLRTVSPQKPEVIIMSVDSLKKYR